MVSPLAYDVELKIGCTESSQALTARASTWNPAMSPSYTRRGKRFGERLRKEMSGHGFAQRSGYDGHKASRCQMLSHAVSYALSSARARARVPLR